MPQRPGPYSWRTERRTVAKKSANGRRAIDCRSSRYCGCPWLCQSGPPRACSWVNQIAGCRQPKSAFSRLLCSIPQADHQTRIVPPSLVLNVFHPLELFLCDLQRRMRSVQSPITKDCSRNKCQEFPVCHGLERKSATLHAVLTTVPSRAEVLVDPLPSGGPMRGSHGLPPSLLGPIGKRFRRQIRANTC